MYCTYALDVWPYNSTLRDFTHIQWQKPGAFNVRAIKSTWDFLGLVFKMLSVRVCVCARVRLFNLFFGSVSMCVNLNMWTNQYYRAIFFVVSEYQMFKMSIKV